MDNGTNTGLAMHAARSDLIHSGNAILREEGITPLRKDLVQRALAILAAERERSGEPIVKASIERICILLELTPAEILRLETDVDRQELTRQDMDFGDEEAEAAPIPEENVGADLIGRMMRHSLLTAEEERELGRAVRLAKSFRESLAVSTIQHGADVAKVLSRGQHAQRVLTLSNVRLVMDIARRHEGRGLELDDLLQEGIIGLMRAVDCFDASLGFRFSTYATWWIKQSIMRAVANTGRTVRLPVHVAERLSKLRRTVRKLRAKTGAEFIKPQAIADELGWTAERVGQLLVLDAQRFVTETPDDDDGQSILDRLPSPLPDPETSMVNLDFRRYLDRCLDGLDQRAGDILRHRFGLTGKPAQTLEEIGGRYQLTRERIRQIQSRNLTKMGVRHRDDLEIFFEEKP